MRVMAAGASVVVEGLPSGVPVSVKALSAGLGRWRAAAEDDPVMVLAGVREGVTDGGPVAVFVERPPELDDRSSSRPRPGTGDLVSLLKYGRPATVQDDEGHVLAGSLVSGFLEEIEICVLSHVVRMGGVGAPRGVRPAPGDLPVLDRSPVRCFDVIAADAMVAEAAAAFRQGDSLGGVVEVLVYGLPAGIGSGTHWDRALDGLIAQSVMSIAAVNGVEFGDGFDLSSSWGTSVQDGITWAEDVGYGRASNRAGGVEAGMSTGEVLVVRASVRPPLPGQPVATVDLATKESAMVSTDPDPSAVPATAVVAESMVACVVGAEVLRKAGGDSLDEVRHNLSAYRRTLHWV